MKQDVKILVTDLQTGNMKQDVKTLVTYLQTFIMKNDVNCSLLRLFLLRGETSGIGFCNCLYPLVRSQRRPI